MTEEFAHVEFSFIRNRFLVWIGYYEDRKRYVMQDGKAIEMDELEVAEPTMTLSPELFSELLSEMVEAAPRHPGLSTEKDALVEAKNENLRDLRTLLGIERK